MPTNYVRQNPAALRGQIRRQGRQPRMARPDWMPQFDQRMARRGGQANQGRLRRRAQAQQAPGANLPPGAAELQEALRAIAANNPMNPGTLPDIPTLNQELQRLLAGQSPMPAHLQEMQRVEPQRPPNLPGTGTAMVPPMPSAPPPAQRTQYDQLQRMAQAPAAPPSRPQPWRPQGQRPAPATVGQTTTNPALQDRDRQRGGQSMARPAPQRGGLGIGGLGMESAGPQRQGTGFMSGDLAWTTPQRPSGPSYYEGLMPGSTYSPMEQQRRR